MASPVTFLAEYFRDSDRYLVPDHLFIDDRPLDQLVMEVQAQIRSVPAGKSQVLFVLHDSEINWGIDLGRTILFKSGLSRSKAVKNEYPLPYFFEPIPERFPVIPKVRRRPQIGFCGFSTSHSSRNETLLYLLSRQSIKCDFIMHNVFWGGNPHSPDVVEQFRLNMKKSEFNVCSRGNGNFSMRFYQALSCGRIPVMLDTDQMLPYSNWIDYSQFCVIGHTLESLVDGICAAWEEDRIEQMQEAAYAAYVQYFSFANAPKALHRFLDLVC